MPTLKHKTQVGDSDMAALGYDVFTSATNRGRYLFNRTTEHYIPLLRHNRTLLMWVFDQRSPSQHEALERMAHKNTLAISLAGANKLAVPLPFLSQNAVLLACWRVATTAMRVI